MLSFYTFLSLFTYISWKIWIISDRFNRIDAAYTKTLMAEIFYAIIMSYLLAIASSSFLLVGLFTVMIHIFFGLYVELFKPEIKLINPASSDILLNYWYFILIDTVITFLSYFLMISAGQ